MAERPWIFLTNTFEVRTRKSNRKMLSLVTDTHAKLKAELADPEILQMFNLLDPAYDSYRQICINYDVAKGDYRGDTLAFKNLINGMSVEVRKWESAVRAVYVEDSAEEAAIFPHKRNPFLKSTYESRLSAIGTLAEQLAGIPALSAAHVMVQSFYNQALSTRLAQQEEEGDLAKQSDLRENQRVVVAKALYGVLGLLMCKYRENPEEIDRYFDLSLLRIKSVQ